MDTTILTWKIYSIPILMYNFQSMHAYNIIITFYHVVEIYGKIKVKKKSKFTELKTLFPRKKKWKRKSHGMWLYQPAKIYKYAIRIPNSNT